jgi:hypothetical protein
VLQHTTILKLFLTFYRAWVQHEATLTKKLERKAAGFSVNVISATVDTWEIFVACFKKRCELNWDHDFQVESTKPLNIGR